MEYLMNEELVDQIFVLKISIALRVPSVDEAVKFYKQAFGAVEDPIPSLPEKELNGIQATKLKIHHRYPILITDSPLVPEISPGSLNLCLQVDGRQLADLEAAVDRAVDAGATTNGEVALDPTSGRPSMRLEDPFGVVWYLYVPSDDEISSDNRRERELDEFLGFPVGHPDYDYWSKLKVLVKVPDPEAAVQFYTTTLGAVAARFPTENEIPGLNFTALEFRRPFYVLVSGSAPQNNNTSSGINLCAMTSDVEELVERLKQAGAVVEADIVWDDPVHKFRGMAKLRDPFGVLWFIHQMTLEQRYATLPIRERAKEYDARAREAFRLQEMAAREGRMWPAVAP
ncbi:hypothetical protein Tsubulata_024243 [Turnera subulata]|uniref:VOC domain-containing protein n=1 Tax=Turnera subulata TaxID=218843 RepID=A0A9Q0FDH3_9ROSI|nr:hypothetical protein Tsubulata_024243 [Turnera subulata]